ncbi:response regulator transcription factor [Streptomyces solisilvae]|uniref:response regulator transcription factor n=1 Tax=Streptomyces malaysiensis TaxID=92644 RepID=UPI003694F1C6
MGVRLMVVDDHRLLAEALASALKLRGHRVLAAAAPSAGAADLVVSRAPEVCLLGTASPAEPGVFDPVMRIKKERPQVAVVVLGPVPSPRGIAAAFAAGASGYVRHDERIEGVERAMMKARAGEAAVAPQLLQGAFAELLNPAAQPDDEGARLLRMLTPREVEVLVRVAEGEDTRLIAAGMGIAPSTARTHVQRVLMKLGVGSRLEAAALAARTGLLDRAASRRTAEEPPPQPPASPRPPASAP